MNASGCPAGLATDQILFYENVQLACDMSISAWIGMGSALVFAKGFTAIGHTNMYYERERAYKQKNPRELRRRIPWVPLLSWLMFLNYVLFFVLPALEVANSKNGVAGFFFGLGWLLFGCLSVIFLLKFIALGYKIIPTQSRVLSQKDHDRLSQFEWKGKLSFALSIAALACQTVMLCIVGLIVPDDYTIIRIASGFHAWFTAQHGISMTIHIERIKKA